MAARSKEAMSTESISLNVTELQGKLEDDDYQRMKAALSVSGRGRPPKLHPLPLTNKLLLQLESLRLQLNKTWDDMCSFFPKVTDPELLKGFNLKKEIEAVLGEGARCKKEGTHEDFDKFLSFNLGLSILGRNVGPHLRKHQILRKHLLDFDLLKELAPPPEVSHGMIIDLVHFFKIEKIPLVSCRNILELWGVSLGDLSDQQLNSRLKKITTTQQSLMKSLKRQNGQQKMNQFLSSTADFSVQTVHSPQSFPTEGGLKLLQAERTAAALRRQLEETNTRMTEEIEKNSVLKETAASNFQELQNMTKDFNKMKMVNAKLEKNNDLLNQKLKQAQQTIKEIRGKNHYKRLKRKEITLQAKQRVIDSHENGQCAVKQRRLKRQIKLEQTKVSSLKRQISSLRTKLESKTNEFKEAVQDFTRSEKNVQIQTRKENSSEFTNEIKITTIALLAAQVSAENCPRVIQTVATYLFGVDIPSSDLPSERTVRRYADQGHVLAKAQVAEAVGEHKFDLHADGTTRDKKKYVGYQVTTSEGSLSCGFTSVAVENANTLVETTMHLLQELTEIFPPDERDQHFKTILRNLTGVMTDRAAVMKKFKKDLNDAVQATLGTEVSLEYLGCNAHFLLGISSKTGTSLAEVQEQRMENRIGRDSEPQFSRFHSSEAAALRYVRMACDVLGPRGDEKSGCRDAWIAFCAFNNTPSKVTSFKTNRFNNLFEAATALHYHRKDIITFLRDYMPNKNSKLQSVLSDATSDQVAVYNLVLAMLFFRLTGPYWQLLGSKIHYLDFSAHVVAMRNQLINWGQDAHEIFDADLPSLFGFPPPDSPSFRVCIAAEETTKQNVINIFQFVCQQLVTVVNLQLSEFLPNGRYHNVTDEGMRERLSHSQVTNLVGEACFGDLDLSIYKRRNASCHHHATLTMLSRNRTIDSWFSRKSTEQQRDLLKLSAEKGQKWRKQHRQDEQDVITQRKLLLEQNFLHKEQQKAALQQKKERIITAIHEQHGGPCHTPEDVDRLLQKFQLQKERRAALHLQMNYLKCALDVKSPLLRTSFQNISQLANNLKRYFRQVLGLAEPDGDQAHQDSDEEMWPASSSRLSPDPEQMETDDEETQEVTSHSEGAASDGGISEPEADVVLLEDFVFTSVGENIAVYYDDDFHIGCVSSVHSPEKADINFLSKCGVANNTFVWPVKTDTASVHSMFVFAKGFDIVSKTSTGRIWSVPAYKELCQKYAAYKKKYA